jgi:anti-sigma B factor antagonist
MRPTNSRTMAPAPFRVASEPAHSGAVRLRIAGEVDIATSGALADALEEAERSNAAAIIVDLAALTFIDSSGLHVLLSSARRCQEAGRPITATNVPDYVRRLFALVALDEALTVDEDAQV